MLNLLKANISQKKTLLNTIPKYFFSAKNAIEETKEKLQVGMKGQQTFNIREKYCTNRSGKKGDDILSSPSMILFMEIASVNAIEPKLDDQFASVGYHVDVKHFARTDLGAQVTAHAQITEIQGKKITLKVEAYEEPNQGGERKLIGKGYHRRAVIKTD
ncbi:hypothetical protein M0813_13067 [Anaeramoeba flamelloides]|uniref:Fluoroacetyl-CoA-specific thioesterase-like domain-containing protein n=1 Tax=Anaeramoeba flamelloides TaxID=1746091 RepID=A0ABQ8Z9V5_9EUKA|nr:hypothetical protein M0813_13067 [Anaeramoeba flamelloides]